MKLRAKDKISDLLGEVRACRRRIERGARAAARDSMNAATYGGLIHAMLDEQLHSRALRERVVGYAMAAELGVLVSPPADIGRLAAGDEAFALRVLFWAAHRRMRGLR